MADGFDKLVQEGHALGLDRPKAEARARDLLYGDPPPQAPAPAAEAFTSIDELWKFLQATWESRSNGAELVDVLECINDLLERGVISQELFGEVMRRTTERRKQPEQAVHPASTATSSAATSSAVSASASASTSASAFPSTSASASASAYAAGDAPSAADDARASAEALSRSVLLVQRVVRGWRGRERFAWVVHDRAREIKVSIRASNKYEPRGASLWLCLSS